MLKKIFSLALVTALLAGTVAANASPSATNHFTPKHHHHKGHKGGGKKG